MRSRFAVRAALIGAAFFVGGALAQERPAKLWLLENPKLKQWCAYTDQMRWEMEREAIEWATVGAVDYKDGKISRVFLSVPGDTGKWVVSDQYLVNDRGVMETVTRYTDHFTGGFYEKSVYWLEEQQAVLLSREVRTAGDDVLLPADPDSKQDATSHTYKGQVLQDLPVWLKLDSFPFSSFLTKEHTEVWDKGRTCTAGE